MRNINTDLKFVCEKIIIKQFKTFKSYEIGVSFVKYYLNHIELKFKCISNKYLNLSTTLNSIGAFEKSLVMTFNFAINFIV